MVHTMLIPYHSRCGRQLYGIVQGGVYPDLRKEAVDFVNKAPFFGIAVGGSLGADKVITASRLHMSLRYLLSHCCCWTTSLLTLSTPFVVVVAVSDGCMLRSAVLCVPRDANMCVLRLGFVYNLFWFPLLISLRVSCLWYFLSLVPGDHAPGRNSNHGERSAGSPGSPSGYRRNR